MLELMSSKCRMHWCGTFSEVYRQKMILSYALSTLNLVEIALNSGVLEALGLQGDVSSPSPTGLSA